MKLEKICTRFYSMTIDLSNESSVNEELKKVLCFKDDLICRFKNHTINEKRQFILEYYTNNYSIFYEKSNNIYEIRNYYENNPNFSIEHKKDDEN